MGSWHSNKQLNSFGNSANNNLTDLIKHQTTLYAREEKPGRRQKNDSMKEADFKISQPASMKLRTIDQSQEVISNYNESDSKKVQFARRRSGSKQSESRRPGERGQRNARESRARLQHSDSNKLNSKSHSDQFDRYKLVKKPFSQIIIDIKENVKAPVAAKSPKNKLFMNNTDWEENLN